MEAHGQGWLTAIAAILAALGVPGLIISIANRANREPLVDALRKALDKGRVRENAYCGALDALIMGIDQLDNPPAALVAARKRALERMELAHCQLKGGSQ